MFIVKWATTEGREEFFQADYVSVDRKAKSTNTNFVRFYSEPSKTEVIIDTGVVYIMNENGKTVDKYWLAQ